MRAVLVCAALFGLADEASFAREPPAKDAAPLLTDSPIINAGRDALRQIVQNNCLPNWAQKHDPTPCERVVLADAKSQSSGYAVLADQKGGAHYLLIPTQTMHGTDASELLDPDLPNYFAEAWQVRDVLTGYVHHAVPRSAVGLAINSSRARGQDQFHIHIECLRQDVVDSLKASAEGLSDVWSPITVAGSTYQGQALLGEGFEGSNPFELLAKLGPGVRGRIGDYTLLVAGYQFKKGPGFVLLTGNTGPTGELLLDSTCAVAGGAG